MHPPAIVLILALALGMMACRDRDRRSDPVSPCPGVSLVVSCDGGFPKILDGGYLHCPDGCSIDADPCPHLYGEDERPPNCQGVECGHYVVCSCDGAPCE